jgi:hypothetical protein
MRAHFGIHFFGQVATFAYLTQTMRFAPQFDIAAWPQFSIYNVLVANFWPLYWVARLIDPLRLDHFYWRVFEVAAARAADLHHFAQSVSG